MAHPELPTANESISVDLPECEWFRRLWFVWDDVPEAIRVELCELAEGHATVENDPNAIGLVADGQNAID